MTIDDLARRVLQLERENRAQHDMIRQLRQLRTEPPSQGSRTAILQATASIAGRSESSGVYTISTGSARMFDLVVDSAGVWTMTAVKAGATERTVTLGNLSSGSLAANQFIVAETVNGAWVYNGDCPLVHAKTPIGGIPAISTLTMGSAMCDIYTSSTAGVLSDSGLDEMIYNMSSSAVAPSTHIIAARNSAGRLVVIVEDCG